MSLLFYRGMRMFLKTTFKLSCHFKVEGEEHIPLNGGVLIASNHASYLDPPLVASAMPRPIFFMARASLFRNAMFAKIIGSLQAIPVKRGRNDSKAMNRIIEVMKNGSPALVFPEGTRSKDGGLGDANPGFALLAIKAGVPILPVYIDGSYSVWSRHQKWFKPAPITVRYGPVIDSNMYSDQNLTVGRQARCLAEEVMRQISDIAKK